MQHRKFFAVLALLLLALGAALPARAFGIKDASLTVYGSGRALVGESRTVNLPKGPAEVVFRNIPATLDPTSVSATAEGMTVTGLEYRAVPITARNLLDRYVGRELSVILPDPADNGGRILRKAVLLANADTPVFQVGNEIYLGDAVAYLLPALPEGVQAEPSLVLHTENAAAAKRAIRLRYLMNGLSWRADYTLSLDAAGRTGALDAWASVTNDAAFDFTDATLRLAAGDLGRSPAPMVRKMVMLGAGAVEADNAPREEAVAQFHVYTVPGAVDLPAGDTRQLGLLSATGVAVEEDLSSRWDNGLRQLSRSQSQPVRLTLRLTNTRDKGLGTPLPAGVVRVYRPTSDGGELLLGEPAVGHTGVGGTLDLPLGNAFDLSVTRTQTEFARLGKQSVRVGWVLDVTNGRPAPQRVRLVEGYAGEWQVTAADHPHTRPDAGSLEFDVTVPPTPDGKPLRISYTVQATY